MEKYRILYIEDDGKQRKALTRSLRLRGYSVSPAASGATGLRLFGNRTFDAIICDLNMPSMNGLQVLEKVRARNKNIPIIILTAHGTVSIAVKALKEGANHFILKPAEINEIIIAIDRSIEHNLLEQKLHESETTLRMVMENVPDAIFSLNEKGELISLSPSVESVLGYKPGELIGRSVFDVIYDEDRDQVRQGFRESIQTGKTRVRTLQFRMVAKSGEIKHFEVSRKLIFDGNKVIRTDGIARDISDRIELQNRLKEYSRQLEDKVIERTRRLEYANIQLAALNEASTKFGKIYNEDKLFDEIPRMLTKSLGFDRAYLIVEEEKSLRVRSWCCLDNTMSQLEAYIKRINSEKLEIPPHFKRSLRQRKTIFVRDLKKDRRWPKKPAFLAKARSMVISPIKVKKQVFGLIAGFMDRPEYEMNEQDVQRCVTFANIVGMAIDNIKTYQSLEIKVAERTQSLKSANEELKLKARTIEKSQIELARANVELLSVQEQLQQKNSEMEALLKQLSESKNVLQAIIDVSSNAILMVDSGGKVIATNRRISDMFGLAINEVVERNIDQVQSKIKDCFDDPDRFDRLDKELRTRPDLNQDRAMDPHLIRKRTFKTTGKTNRYISVFCISIPSMNSEKMSRLWTYIDITKIVQADEQLHLIVEASPIPLIITRLSDGEIMFANEHLADLVGSTPEELVGQKSPDFYYRREDRELVVRRLKRDGFLKNHEVRLKRLDGSVFWAIFSLVVADISGEPAIIGGIMDIDERRRMEDELRWERNFVSAILDTAGALVLVLDNEGRIVRFNKASQNTTGYSFDEVKGKYFWDILLLPEELDEVKAVFQSLKAGHFPNSHENYFLHKDGSKRLIAWSNTALTDDNGEVEYIIATGLDLTERKRAAETIAARLRYEEGLADCLQALLAGKDYDIALTEALGYLLKAADTGRVYIFENFEDEKDGLCMRQTHEVCSPGVEPQIGNLLLQHAPYNMGFDSWREILARGEAINSAVDEFPEAQREILEPQGILSMLVLPIIVSGQWFGFIGFDEVKERRIWGGEDIRMLQTASEIIGLYIEHRKSEETLRVSEERFRGLVENANDIIYSVSKDGNFTYISPTATDILGYKPEDFIGKPMHQVMHPEDKKETMKSWQQGLLKTRPRWSGNRFRLMHSDGSYRWFVSNSSVIRDSNGEIIEIVGVAHDITEIQNLLEALETKNEQLKAAQSQLVQSEKMASLGMLVAGIAHEINTPIGAASSMHDTSVRAMARLKTLLKNKFSREFEEDDAISKTFKIIDDANKVIESGAGRITNIVRRLRSFARLDEAELKKVDIHEGLEDTLTLIHHEIKHDITVIRDFGDIPLIACFPGQLNQVFLNLLVNASQAIKGKGTIAIKTRKLNNKIRIEIEDSGIGIPRKNLARIFDPGFTTKGVGVGTGLGLSICYQIISSHRGSIKAESEAGKGAKFIIELPINLDEILESENNRTKVK